MRGIEQAKDKRKLGKVIAPTTGREVVREPVDVVRFDESYTGSSQSI